MKICKDYLELAVGNSVLDRLIVFNAPSNGTYTQGGKRIQTNSNGERYHVREQLGAGRVESYTAHLQKKKRSGHSHSHNSIFDHGDGGPDDRTAHGHPEEDSIMEMHSGGYA